MSSRHGSDRRAMPKYCGLLPLAKSLALLGFKWVSRELRGFGHRAICSSKASGAGHEQERWGRPKAPEQAAGNNQSRAASPSNAVFCRPLRRGRGSAAGGRGPNVFAHGRPQAPNLILIRSRATDAGLLPRRHVDAVHRTQPPRRNCEPRQSSSSVGRQLESLRAPRRAFAGRSAKDRLFADAESEVVRRVCCGRESV